LKFVGKEVAMKQQTQWSSANIEEVVKGIGNKESDAYEEFFNRTVNKAYTIANKVLGDQGNTADVEDMIQDAYITAFNKIDSLQDPDKALSWFGVIVGNKCRDHLKKKKDILFEEMDTDDSSFEDTIENEYQEFIPEASVDYSETKRLMEEIVDGLPKDQKLCTLLFYYNDLSVKEIAEALDCSENTVKSRLSYSRKKIEEEVKTLEKKGTKLYSIAPMPFISWMLEDAESTLYIPEVLKANVLGGIDLESTAASVAAKSTEAKVITTGATTAGKAIAAKIIAGAVAAFLAIGGGLFISKHGNESASPVENIETQIIDQLDYDFLKTAFCYLPLYDSNDPISDQEMDKLIYISLAFQYQNGEASLTGEDKRPTFFNSDNYIEIAETDIEKYFGTNLDPLTSHAIDVFAEQYMRVEGDRFDEIARAVSFDKSIEELIREQTDTGEPPWGLWDNDTIMIFTSDIGGIPPIWDVIIEDTVAKDGFVEVNYKLVFSEWYSQEEIYESYRTAHIELIDGKYVITSISESEDSNGAVSICEYYTSF